MTTEKLVNIALFGKTELANQKVELAFDFSNYIKQTDTALKATGVATDKLNKAAALYAEAKKSLTQFQGVPDAYQKNIDAYYKNYDKTAKELGIDTKTTQFYKEYVDVASKIGQIKDNVDQMKSAVASVK
jgi:DNA-binding SARP family transcriptional activator